MIEEYRTYNVYTEYIKACAKYRRARSPKIRAEWDQLCKVLYEAMSEKSLKGKV